MKKVFKSNKRLHCLMGVLSVCLALVLASCGGHASRQLKREVDSFAVNYFNWQYHKALHYVTPESEKWIRYAASQVHQADIDLLRQKERPATCEIRDIDIDDNDSLAVAHVTIHDFLRMDTIGEAATLINAADYDIPLRYLNDKEGWMVDLKGALREVE